MMSMQNLDFWEVANDLPLRVGGRIRAGYYLKILPKVLFIFDVMIFRRSSGLDMW